MADPGGISGIRATGLRPVAILKRDNYRSWAVKLKVQLMVMECWDLVTGTELPPPATAPAGADAAAQTAALDLRKLFDKRRIGACAVLITSISDDELHVVHGIEEDPLATWTRLKEKFERRSEQEAEASFMRFLDFTHIESETANEMIERYETSLQNCLDQGVVVDVNMRQRMLIGRPADRYKFLKQNYLLAIPANKPDLEALKAQLRDIDADHRKPQGGANEKTGQGHRSEANWGQTSNSGGDRQRDKNSGRSGSIRGERGSGDRDKSGSSNGDSKGEVICYCCGQRGHIKPECPKKGEECHKCGKVGHLQSMCKSSKDEGDTSGGSSTPEAGQFETYDGFAFETTIGVAEDYIEESSHDSKSNDIWGYVDASHTSCPDSNKGRYDDEVSGAIGVRGEHETDIGMFKSG